MIIKTSTSLSSWSIFPMCSLSLAEYIGRASMLGCSPSKISEKLSCQNNQLSLEYLTSQPTIWALFTSIKNPFLLYDPVSEEYHEKMGEVNENTIFNTSVDHLPTEMPKETSNHFGSQLLPFIKAVAASILDLPLTRWQTFLTR